MSFATANLKGDLHHHYPLAKFTSWRVGGECEVFFRPQSIADLAEFLSQLPEDEPLLYLGLGSNLLVRDGGVRGAVVLIHGLEPGIERIGGARVRAGAGAPCAKVARFVANESMAGGTFLAGIPGTIGGALAMNAGAFGGETWDRVIELETLARTGELRRREPSEFNVGYRSVEGIGEEVFVGATFEFESGDAEAERAKIKTLLAQRGASQPTGVPSCGSVFRNPEGDFAARLIEAAGLKGATIGGAEVSEKHANFILNRGSASAGDIEALITRVQETVADKFGVLLHREVRIVGEAP
ncbi:MAG: UDP-N-acetylmuramate dehydrogenase [bacterium]